MSPTLVFPPPFRSRDLPPYGHTDWHALQPALLRRSLMLSSAIALLFGLLLTVVLQQVATVVPVIDPRIILPPPAPPEPGYVPPSNGPVAKVQDNGVIIPKEHELPAVRDSMIPPSNPGPFDPNATHPIGTVSIPGNAVVAPAAPERPDPDKFVALDDLPREVYAPKPEYPEIARQAQMEGTVVLRVLVSKEGKVQEVIVKQSSPVFDDAAESAIRRWQFRPAIMGHEPVAAWVTIPVRFVLNE